MFSVWKIFAEKGKCEDTEKATITEEFTFWKTKGRVKTRNQTGKGHSQAVKHTGSVKSH